MKTPKQLYNIGKFTVRFEWTYKLYFENFYICNVRENKLNFSFDLKLVEIEGDLPKILPSFFGEDVTNNSYYKNKNLSK